jgi:predicted amidohydrolase YtcJ
MLPRALRVTCLLAIVGVASLHAQRPGAAAPDLILTGGKVFTADPARPWAEAVAIRGERLVAVGTSAEVARLAGPSTRRIELGGRVVVPGLNDAHDHLGGAPFGVSFRTGDSPRPDPEVAPVLDSVRALATRTPAGSWIQATVGMRVVGDTGAIRARLDEAAPNHPVFLWAWWGHGFVLNSAGLRALGIGGDARDPLGGWYERGADGRPTGRLWEYAGWGPLRDLTSALPDSVLVAHLRRYADTRIGFGVTSVQDMAGYLDPPTTLRVLRQAALPIRVRVVRWSNPDFASLRGGEWSGVETHPAPRVRVHGTKWVVDGTPIERLALQRKAYPGRPEWHGRLNLPMDTLRALLADAFRGGDPLLLHVVGDSTAEIVLSLMEEIGPASAWKTRRLRLEHGNGITGAQVERARRLGIVIAQPRTAPFRTWLDAGIPVAYGSDMAPNPFVDLMLATTSPADPSQAITREEAVTMLTRVPAYAEWLEDEKGTLAPGMLADLAVLSQDVFTVPAPALPATTSVLTVVGGRIVHDRLTEAPPRADPPR